MLTFLPAQDILLTVISCSPLPVFLSQAERPSYVDGHHIKGIFPCSHEWHDEAGSRYWHEAIVRFPGRKCEEAMEKAILAYAAEIEAQSGTALEQDFS